MFTINPHGGGKPNVFSHSSLFIKNKPAFLKPEVEKSEVQP
jgi:hypothetical protein